MSPDAATAGTGPDLAPLFGWALVTVLMLVATIVTGVGGRRTAHYLSVALTLVGLGVAISIAGEVGRQLEFTGLAATAKTVHFWVVPLDFLLIPVVAFSGIRLARAAPEDEPARRAFHRKVAWTLVALLVVTVILGTVMTLAATPVGL